MSQAERTPSEQPVEVSATPTPVPLWRRVLPFALGAVLLGWVLYRTDLDQLVDAIGRTNYLAFLGFNIIFLLSLLVADSFATSFIYRRAVCPIRYRELLVIRGASYLPSLINHNIGQAWLTYFLSRVYKAPLWRVAGATLLVYGTNLAGLCLIAALSLAFERERAPWLLPLLLALLAAGTIYMGIIAWAPKLLRDRPIVAPLFEVGVSGQLQAILLRLPHVGALFLGTWLSFAFFDVWVPPADALAVMPLLMFVVALPITPSGVGTRDVAAVQLLISFAPGAPEEGRAAIAAATLSTFVALNIVAAVISPFFMRRASRMLAANHSAEPVHRRPNA